MDVSDAKRLKTFEGENEELLADQMLEVAALKEFLSKNGRTRGDGINHLRQHCSLGAHSQVRHLRAAARLSIPLGEPGRP